MNVLVLTGSPRRRGVTARLADAFCEGASAAGHHVDRFDSAFMDVAPCKACYHCRHHGGKCVYDDDMTELIGEDGKILSADLIVFVSPLYYFSITAQLKAVLDRFYAVGRKMRERKQKMMLITSTGDSDPAVLAGLEAQIASLCAWAHWQRGEDILAVGCHEVADLEKTDFVAKAYAAGKNL